MHPQETTRSLNAITNQMQKDTPFRQVQNSTLQAEQAQDYQRVLGQYKIQDNKRSKDQNLLEDQSFISKQIDEFQQEDDLLNFKSLTGDIIKYHSLDISKNSQNSECSHMIKGSNAQNSDRKSLQLDYHHQRDIASLDHIQKVFEKEQQTNITQSRNDAIESKYTVQQYDDNDIGPPDYRQMEATHRSDHQEPGSGLQELKIIFSKATPASLQASIQFITKLFTLSIIGNFAGTKELAAASLGFTYINVTGISVIFGLSNTLDTFASQSYTINRKMTGVYLQKCVVVTLAISVFIAILWCFSGQLFLLLNIDAEVCQLVQQYVSYSLIGLIPNILYYDIQKFLYAQGVFYPILIVQVFLLPIYCLMQYYFVKNIFGFIGAPIALGICDWIQAAVYIIYARFFNGYQAWGGFTWKAFEGLGEYLRLSFFSVLQTCSEWWAFEITAIEAGWISVDALAAQSILSSTSSFIFTIFVGVSQSASVQVGNYMGAGKAQKAKQSAYLCLLIASGVGAIICVLLLVFRQQWALIFVKRGPILEILCKILPNCALGGIFDAIQYTSGSILRGLGYQNVGAVVNSLSYWVVAIPLGYLLAFHIGLGLQGIWIGMISGMFLQAISQAYYVLFLTNWKKASQDAQFRTCSHEDQTSSLLGDRLQNV